MISKKLISCIIIFFNVDEQFFIEAIESIFAQTYQNWELLLVDDGSTNSSTKIALNYVKKYPNKVRYLEHEGHQNRGMSATRNLGIRHAKGAYITFLDADDLWLSNTLQEQAAILESNPHAAMVYGPIQWWYSWTGNIEDISRDFIDTPNVFLQEPDIYLDKIIPSPTLFFLLLKMRISISGMLIRRLVIDEVGGFEERFKGLYEDQAFCAKICLQFPVFSASNWWYKYRQHPDSCCAIVAKKQKEYWHLQRPVFLKYLEEYLSIKGLNNIRIWTVIKKELLPYDYPVLYFLINSTQRSINVIKRTVKSIILTKSLLKTQKIRV
jgi:glycosyltransferase involved in cell wall biosynthesis